METYQGRIETLNDALVIFEACQQGILHRTTRRLLEKEKEELCGGKVYVFDEAESGIKRWTDGRLWSPSRIIKDFLVYHELVKRDRNIKLHEPLNELLQKRVIAEDLKVHQCSKGTFLLRKDGLLKKTISIKFNGTYQHMVIYEDFIIKDSLADPLLPPQAFEELRYLQPGEDILSSEKLPKVNCSRKNQKRKKEQSAQIDQRQQNYQFYPEQTHINDPYGAYDVIAEAPLLLPNQQINFNSDSAIYHLTQSSPQIQMFNPTEQSYH